MSMPIGIGTFAKDLFVLFGSPVGIVETMSSIEMLNTG
jgi:hypothetical protein